MSSTHSLLTALLLFRLLLESLGSQVGSVADVEAVLGRDAAFPCGTESGEPNDVVHLVLFFRQSDFSRPVFSYDIRGSEAKTWTSAPYSSRNLRFNPQLAALEVSNVSFSDEGLWHCRTEFDIGQSKLTTVNLTVTETPSVPQFVDSQGRRLKSLDGVYNEDEDLLIFCQVPTGKPIPSLHWFLDSDAVTQTSSSILATPGHVTSRLHLRRVSRDVSGRNLTCRAANSPLTRPTNISHRLMLNLKPRLIEVSGAKNGKENVLTVSSQDNARLVCTASDSRPPAEVTWWKGSKKLSTFAEIKKINETFVVRSILEWTPLPEEDGQVYHCQVTQSRFPGFLVEERVRLDVLYPPSVQIRLQNSSHEPSALPEGSRVALLCDTLAAKPGITNFTWFVDGKAVTETLMDDSVTVSDGSLVLHRIQRKNSGLYSCAASNSQGTGHSRPLLLKVTHAPVCRTDVPSVIALPDSASTLRALCSVEAEPPVVHFWWSMEEESGITWEIPTDRYTSQELNSEINLLSKDIRDPVRTHKVSPGFLLCWARNPAGLAQKPCRIKLVNQGVPDQLKQCSYSETNVVKISCVPGFDGGSAASYVLRIYQKIIDKEVLTLTNHRPEFVIPAVTLAASENSSDLEAKIFAVNSYGSSEPVFLRMNKLTLRITAGNDHKQPYAEDWIRSMWPWVGIAAGAAAALAAAALAAVCCSRTQRRTHPVQQSHPRSSLESVVSSIHQSSKVRSSSSDCIGRKIWNETTM